MDEDPVDRLTPEQLDALIDGMGDRTAPPLSKHLELAIAAAMHRQRRGQPPLRDGDPVPGCDCERCTGVPGGSPARIVPLKTRARRAAYRDRRPIDVHAARAVAILEVGRRLGWDVDPQRPYVLCPFHDDTRPSLHLNAKKGRAYCNPCGRSWDAIALYREVKGLDFVAAVRELAA